MNGKFKAATATYPGLRVRVFEGDDAALPTHDFADGACSCGDAWRWEERLLRRREREVASR